MAVTSRRASGNAMLELHSRITSSECRMSHKPATPDKANRVNYWFEPDPALALPLQLPRAPLVPKRARHFQREFFGQPHLDGRGLVDLSSDCHRRLGPNRG